VSLEVARLLKEKGYNEETIHYYSSAGKLYLGSGHFNHNACAVNLSAPTKAEAIDWLESKGITIDIHWIRFNENRRWNYSIFNCNTCDTIDTKYILPTRLEAEEAAIIKALKLL
jgi:hypothetical protein